MYIHTYTQPSHGRVHASYASPSARQHVPRSMTAFTGDTSSAMQARTETAAVRRGTWHATLQANMNGGGTHTMGPSSLRSSQEYLGGAREDERLQNRELFDVSLKTAMLKTGSNTQTWSYSRPPASIEHGALPTRGLPFNQASPKSPYARASSPKKAHLLQDFSPYGRSETVGDSRGRMSERVATRSILNPADGPGLSENQVDAYAPTHTAHRKKSSEDSLQADGPHTPRVLVLTPRGSTNSRPLQNVHHTDESVSEPPSSDSKTNSRPFMARTDPITGGSVSNATQTVLEALELLTMTSARIKRNIQNSAESTKESTYEGPGSTIPSDGQGPNSGAASRSAISIGVKNMGSAVRRDGSGQRRRLSLPPSPTTSVGKGSGPDEDSNPYIHATEEVLAEEPCGSSPQSQSDSEVPLNPVVASSRSVAHAAMRPHVPPLRLPPPPSLESVQSAEGSGKAEHSEDSPPTSEPVVPSHTVLRTNDLSAREEDNHRADAKEAGISARERDEDDRIEREPKMTKLLRSRSEIGISNAGVSRESQTKKAADRSEPPKSATPQRGVLRASADAAFLRELDAGAHNAKSLQHLNEALDQLHASHIESDVLRAEVKKGREMGKQLREERDASVRSRDGALQELQACKAEVDRLINAKAETSSPNMFHDSETGQGDSRNGITTGGQGNSSSKSPNNNVGNNCAECEVHKYEYSRMQQEGAMREAKLKEQIDALTKKCEENEAKQASAELESETRIRQLALDVERLKNEMDFTSKKWQESVEQLQTVTENLDAAKSDLAFAKQHLSDTSKELQNTAKDLVEAQTQLKLKTAESDLKSGIAWKQEVDLEAKANELRAAKLQISALEARLDSEHVHQLEADLEACKCELEISRRCSLKESLENIDAIPSKINPAIKNRKSGADEEEKMSVEEAAVKFDSKMTTRHVPDQSVTSLQSPTPQAGVDGNMDSNKGARRDRKLIPDGNTAEPADLGRPPGIATSSGVPNRGVNNRAPTPPLVEADTTVTRNSPSPYMLALHGGSTPIKMRGKVPSSAYIAPAPPEPISPAESGEGKHNDKRSSSPGKQIVPPLDLPRHPLTPTAPATSALFWSGKDSAHDTLHCDIHTNSVLSTSEDVKHQTEVLTAKGSPYNAVKGGLMTSSRSNVAKNVILFDKLDKEAGKMGAQAHVSAKVAIDRDMDAPPGVPFRLAPSPARFEPTTSAHHEGYDEALLGPTPRTQHLSPRDDMRNQTSSAKGSGSTRPGEASMRSDIPDFIYNLGRSSVGERSSSGSSRIPYNGRPGSLQKDDPRDWYEAGYAGQTVAGDISSTRPRSARPASSVASPHRGVASTASGQQPPRQQSIQNSSIHSRHARGSTSGGGGGGGGGGAAAGGGARRGGRAASLSSDIYISDRSFLC